jgi:hypothetical protein
MAGRKSEWLREEKWKPEKHGALRRKPFNQLDSGFQMQRDTGLV